MVRPAVRALRARHMIDTVERYADEAAAAINDGVLATITDELYRRGVEPADATVELVDEILQPMELRGDRPYRRLVAGAPVIRRIHDRPRVTLSPTECEVLLDLFDIVQDAFERLSATSERKSGLPYAYVAAKLIRRIDASHEMLASLRGLPCNRKTKPSNEARWRAICADAGWDEA